MKIVHISDTHNFHSELTLPPCDVLIHSGDIGSRTHIQELIDFLIWFEMQPAKNKVWIAGNHDLCLDKEFMARGTGFQRNYGLSKYHEALELLEKYRVQYLCNASCVIEGRLFYGAPWSPSFHPESWAFNKDRGTEIQKEWARIPSDVEVLITHTPPALILDELEAAAGMITPKEQRRGCADLLQVIQKRLFKLKLHCFGHMHDNYGVQMRPVSRTRQILFSNGAVLNNDYEILVTRPLIIEI